MRLHPISKHISSRFDTALRCRKHTLLIAHRVLLYWIYGGFSSYRGCMLCLINGHMKFFWIYIFAFIPSCYQIRFTNLIFIARICRISQDSCQNYIVSKNILLPISCVSPQSVKHLLASHTLSLPRELKNSQVNSFASYLCAIVLCNISLFASVLYIHLYFWTVCCPVNLLFWAPSKLIRVCRNCILFWCLNQLTRSVHKVCCQWNPILQKINLLSRFWLYCIILAVTATMHYSSTDCSFPSVSICSITPSGCSLLISPALSNYMRVNSYRKCPFNHIQSTFFLVKYSFVSRIMSWKKFPWPVFTSDTSV